MVTNSIQSLAPGEGNYNFLLNAQGRIQGDCNIYRDSVADVTEFILETERSQVAAIQQHLDKFIIMDDVELDPRQWHDQQGLSHRRSSSADRRISSANFHGRPLKAAPLLGRCSVHNGQPASQSSGLTIRMVIAQPRCGVKSSIRTVDLLSHRAPKTRS